jgi:hypothetical protein
MSASAGDIKACSLNQFLTCSQLDCKCERRFPYSTNIRRSRWPRGLRRGSAAAGLLGLKVRIPPGAWMSVCCECCVLSGRGLCVGMVTRPDVSYRLWCVWVWSWILDNEEVVAHWWLLRCVMGKKYFCFNFTTISKLLLRFALLASWLFSPFLDNRCFFWQSWLFNLSYCP